MTGEYHVNWDDQSTASASVVSGTSALDSTLADVNSAVNAMIGHWTDGTAVDAYRERQNQWNTAGDRIKEALTQFSAGLTQAASLSQGTEQTNTSTVA
ncbi:WXG100 family type VII secretion target [Blastococcus sp. Marseille-P5729]|uniref:WXG100 family type VII secretion target n=1 Tax=Blastococcus sp. Marseille-P5729 TaxID=2086582 RepID=UPI000D0F6B8F|nr:WXG100 family type VII secretion target [Blastococcus sp. Marseille-P5729]